jgi:hypothetical protein
MHLETGDLMLFTQNKSPSAWWIFDKAVEYFTHSPYVHVGIVLVDPPFSVSSGTYLWESGYEACVNPETGKQNLGVRLTPLSVVLNTHQNIYVRKCTVRITDAKLTKIHSDVFLKPYDMCLSDWLLATLRLDIKPQKTDRFWCSAFVAYVLTQLGYFPEKTDWSIVRPCDLSSSSNYLVWNAPIYTNDTKYKFVTPSQDKHILSLLGKFADSGIQCDQISDSEICVYLNSGCIHIKWTGFAFEISITEVTEITSKAKDQTRIFTTQKSLLRYIFEILDSRNVA